MIVMINMADAIKNFGEIISTYDLAAGEAVVKRESHTPKIEAPGVVKANEAFELKVSVGPHPNKLEHSIRWIEVYFYEEGRPFNPIMISRIDITPEISEPSAIIWAKIAKSGVIHALEYCNLHGLWSAKKEITVG
jgi:superoxide reductase